MTEVLFYHLERASLEDVLPGLLEKTLQRGWRAVVRAGGRDRVDRLDEHLWTYRDDSFLPHGAGRGKNAAAERQPVWLTDGEDLPNAPHILFQVDNARAAPSQIEELERCVMIFDGRDDAALADARRFWSAVREAGCAATYWRQSPEGRWEKQA